MSESTAWVGDSSKARGHVLLISPLTFSYHLAISDALIALGYTVTWWDERASKSTFYKIALRLFPSMTVRWSERIFRRQLTALEPNAISHILVIKGEGLSQRMAHEIRSKFAAASMGLYLWDGLENVKGVSHILSEFDSVATFDPVDAQANNWFYRPLFGRDRAQGHESVAQLQYDWCFVGTVHSDRHRVIHRLRHREGNDAKHFIFCYFQSPLILMLRMAIDWTLWFAPKGTLSTKAMTATDVALVVERSQAVLDVEHPKQRGFTMRTIETLLAGKKLATTNKHVMNSNFYHPSRLCVINREDPEIPKEFLAQTYLPLDAALRHYYSCEGWADELLALQDAAKRQRSNPTSNA